jgi:hypothetical protein
VQRTRFGFRYAATCRPAVPKTTDGRTLGVFPEELAAGGEEQVA